MRIQLDCVVREPLSYASAADLSMPGITDSFLSLQMNPPSMHSVKLLTCDGAGPLRCPKPSRNYPKS